MPTGNPAYISAARQGLLPQPANPNPTGPVTNAVAHDPTKLIHSGPTFDMFSQAKLNDLIGRALYQFPINAAYRASVAQRKVMFNDPRNSPSRSQFSQGYTAPFQYFASQNSWQTPAGQVSRGRRPTIPSIRYVGPQVAIPVAMPWG